MAKLGFFDAQEEGHEHVVVHGPQCTAREELVRPTLLLVLQDIEAHVVVILQRHAILVGDLFSDCYSHVEIPFNASILLRSAAVRAIKY